MHSLFKTPWAVLLTGAGALACSHNTPTGASNDSSANSGQSGVSNSSGGTSNANGAGALSTSAGSDTTTGSGATGTTAASNGGATSTGVGGSADTGGPVSTVVPGAEGFDCTPADGSTPSLKLTEVASGLYAPVGIYFAPGDPNRGYITLVDGVILVLEGGDVLETPFLDISDRVEREDEQYEERGLLGMAFDPDFQNNHRFFLDYTTGGAENGDGENVISAFTASGDPNVADAGSEQVLLTIPQPNDNHNGGGLAIGLDGNLYVGVGDGGFEGVPAADVHDNGQNPNSLLGAVLRIGLDGSVPAGNMAGALPEVWDIGIRNPWRISFDGCTGDLYIADVGFEGEPTSSEEVNVELPMAGGQNYGWPIMEGDGCREEDCDMSPFVLPTDFYGWQAGSAVIGGYVYRGSAIPGLRGTYVFADFSSAEFRAFEYAGGVASNSRKITSDLNPGGFQDTGSIVSLGQDPTGEMYVVAWHGPPMMIHTEGTIYRIDPE